MVGKAQTSMEFLFLTIFLVLMFSAFYVHIQHKNADVLNEKINTEALLIAEKVAYEINMAAAQGDGYSKEFEIPSVIYMIFSYNLSVSGGFVFVDTGDNSRASPTAVDDINGSVSKGSNTILNSGGVIYVS